APSTNIALPSTRAIPRPSWSSDSMVRSVVGVRAERAVMPCSGKKSAEKRRKAANCIVARDVMMLAPGKIRVMRLLAFDTSTHWLSVACGAGETWCVRAEAAGQAHSERLLPLVHAVLAE